MAIITISRLTGSGGREIAMAIADRLNFQLIDRTGMGAVVEREFPIDAIAEIAARHNVVILGSGGQFLFAKVPNSLHVQIVAPLSYRTARVMKLARVDRVDAEKLMEKRDRDKEVFLRKRYGKDWRDPTHYDLVLNIDRFSNDLAIDIILKAASGKSIEAKPAEPSGQGLPEISFETTVDLVPEFAHPSEREFARVMDFYRIRWQYEPRTFPIEWDENKNVAAAFTPDFYLPDLDLFIELTTMKQSLVTKKNRKVRLLRELYPDINIKILYERDYKNLTLKYGLQPGNNRKAELNDR